ncbi:MAG: hypothetical protein IKW24_04275, partial [Clostridia bacterium]|nr:hypothetical protein [Clostridia bacterium]
ELLANGINHPCREMHGMFAELLYETIFGAASTMPEPEDAPAPAEQQEEQEAVLVPLAFEQTEEKE